MKRARYITVFVETSAAGRFLTQVELAQLAGVARETVSRWKQDPTFLEQIDAALTATCRGSAWRRAELAAAARATKGSIRDMELYLEHGGPTSWRGASAGVLEASGNGGSTQAAAIVNIYGIPQPGDRLTLPPPIMRDAAGQIVPVPPSVPIPSTVVVHQEPAL